MVDVKLLEPQSDYMLLEMADEEKKSGIILPDGAEPEKDESALFRILAIGPGYLEMGRFVDTRMKSGDVVMVAAYGISKFTWDGKKVLLSRERDVILKRKES